MSVNWYNNKLLVFVEVRWSYHSNPRRHRSTNQHRHSCNSRTTANVANIPATAAVLTVTAAAPATAQIVAITAVPAVTAAATAVANSAATATAPTIATTVAITGAIAGAAAFATSPSQPAAGKKTASPRGAQETKAGRTRPQTLALGVMASRRNHTHVLLRQRPGSQAAVELPFCMTSELSILIVPGKARKLYHAEV